MKRVIGVVVAVFASAAFAGEDSADRAYSYGPAWYETKCSVQTFNWFARTKSEALKCLPKPAVIQGNGNFFIAVPAKR